MTVVKLGRRCAAAILVTEAGRYLLQHRDNHAWINFPDHWCCFGGVIEPYELADVALRRELREEIEYEAGALEFFTEVNLVLPFGEPRLEHISFFVCEIPESKISYLTLREGAELALFKDYEVAQQQKVVPWDLAAVLMHARCDLLFPTKSLIYEVSATPLDQ